LPGVQWRCLGHVPSAGGVLTQVCLRSWWLVTWEGFGAPLSPPGLRQLICIWLLRLLERVGFCLVSIAVFPPNSCCQSKSRKTPLDYFSWRSHFQRWRSHLQPFWRNENLIEMHLSREAALRKLHHILNAWNQIHVYIYSQLIDTPDRQK